MHYYYTDQPEKFNKTRQKQAVEIYKTSKNQRNLLLQEKACLTLYSTKRRTQTAALPTPCWADYLWGRNAFQRIHMRDIQHAHEI